MCERPIAVKQRHSATRKVIDLDKELKAKKRADAIAFLVGEIKIVEAGIEQAKIVNDAMLLGFYQARYWAYKSAVEALEE